MAQPKQRLPKTEGNLPSSKKQKTHPEPWLGILYQHIRTSDERSAEDMVNDLRNQTSHQIRKLPGERRFGNDFGLEKMNQFDKLQHQVNLLIGKDESKQKEIRALKERTIFLEPMKQGYSILRRHVLEGKDEDQGSDKEAVDRRNESAHGGNILVDCSVLKELREEGSTKLELCHGKFLEMYGIEFQIIDDAINKASPSVTALYDFRAHTRLLYRWKNAKGERKTIATDIEKKCSEAISRWESWVKEKEPRTVSEPNTDEAAREVRELYGRF